MDELQQMQDMLAEYQAGKPSKTDPSFLDANGNLDQLVYQAAYQTWSQEVRQIIDSISALRNEKMGVAELPDGSLVPIEDLSPEEQDYVKQYNTQLYDQLLAKHGLEQFSLRSAGIAQENQNRVDEFNAKRGQLQDKISLEGQSLDRALAEVDKWLSGQEIAGGDADRIQNARQELTKWGTTGGKTSFSGADLGAGMDLLAQQGGVPGGAPLINYPGIQTWDPVGDREASMTGMGLDPSAMPQIPQSVLSFDDIPQLGQLGSAGTSPGSAMLPAPPPTLPPWKPNIDLAGIGAGIAGAMTQPTGASGPWQAGLDRGQIDPVSRPNGLNALLTKLQATLASAPPAAAKQPPKTHDIFGIPIY